MNAEDANDVAKALAAFGAPSIRYHSFGQAQVKPSNVVISGSGPVPAPQQSLSSLPTPLRQAEPEVALEPPVNAAPAPVLPPMPPVPAFRRTLDPAIVASRPAPPPRPLIARPADAVMPDAMATPSTPLTQDAPPHFTVRAPNGPASSPLTPGGMVSFEAPVLPAPQPPSPAPTIVPRPMPPQTPPAFASEPVALAAGLSRPSPTRVAGPPDRSTFEHPAGSGSLAGAKKYTLKEIFALLALGSPAEPAAPRL